MDHRIEFHNEMKQLLGSNNVYFQPPENVKIKYPAIIYSRTRIDTTFANNNGYKLDHAYQVVYVHSNPDDPLIDQLALFPTARFQREYTSDNLYHTVFIIYFK
jgi:hypothetical protein